MLGADLGSSLVVQILSIDLHWLMPVLMIAGGALFFKARPASQPRLLDAFRRRVGYDHSDASVHVLRAPAVEGAVLLARGGLAK